MNSKRLILLTAALFILAFLQPVFGAIGLGIPPEKQELMPGPAGEGTTEAGPKIQIRILLFSLSKPFGLSSPGGLVIRDASGNSLYVHDGDKPLEFQKDDGGMIGAKDAQWNRTQSVTVEAAVSGQPVKIGRTRYRGRIILTVAGNSVRIINRLDLEEYLYGVVPKEFRTKFAEMAKAQAVVARTFAVAHLGRFEKDGYDFTDDTRFQVYGGFDAEDPDSTKAVDDTKGQVLTYYGKLVQFALYHSTCGGMTSDNESVFLTGPIGYLRPVRCLWCPPGESSAKDESSPSPENFAATLDSENEAMCSSSRYYRWEVQWTEQQLLEDVRLFTRDNSIKEIRDVKITKRSSSGRALEMEIETDRGKITAKANAIRNALRIRLPGGGISSLYSTRFAIWKDKNMWKAKGAGWGHGLGLCQFGGLGMAKRGAGYVEILQKYFFNCQVTELNRVEGLKVQFQP